jgi:MazG family protein
MLARMTPSPPPAGAPAVSDRERAAFARLLEVCRRLRGPGGCPWDQEQTLSSMTPYLTEEAAESAEAIASGDTDHVAEELGDLAFLSIFCLELNGEGGGAGLAEGLERGADKLVRRHPHVFGDAVVKDGEGAYRQWQEIKRAEKGDVRASLLGDQPKGLPALVAAYRTQEKAGAVGFDWPDLQGPLAKLREEMGEIEHELDAERGDTSPALAREIGDLLFAVTNVARHLGVDPERELRAAVHRFRDRFHHIERRLAEQGRTPASATLEEMDALWEEAKRLGSGFDTGPAGEIR